MWRVVEAPDGWVHAGYAARRAHAWRAIRGQTADESDGKADYVRHLKHMVEAQRSLGSTAEARSCETTTRLEATSLDA